MDNKLKNRIISAVRKISYSHKPRNIALNKRKVAPNAFRCDHCGVIVYKGTKDLFDTDLTERFEHVIVGRFCMDHINPVIDPTRGFVSFDEYFSRMFCDEEGWQGLCDPCHNVKTQKELEIRKHYRKLNKEVNGESSVKKIPRKSKKTR